MEGMTSFLKEKKTMDIKVWNAGRRYTEYGQRIAAAQVGDTVYFVDNDRNIEGCYTVKSPEVALSTDELQREVMLYYDGNNYKPIPTWTEEGKRIRDALVAAALREGQAETPPALERKTFEVWYVKPGFTRDFLMGHEWLLKHTPELIPATPDNLKKTHVRLATIRASDADEVFMWLQGENWSPNGEARKLIQSLKLDHTSMSVSDVVVIDGKITMCDTAGWATVGDAEIEEAAS
jgi:hypothetical protein